jgi:predicted KAP-like P-loop ATPase
MDSSEYLQCDIATEEDSLGFKLYVESIADFLISEKTVPPLTLSIEGQWGCGKSSFMLQLKKRIEYLTLGKEDPTGKSKSFTVWFNSWRYDKEDELWAAFAINLMDQLSQQLSFWQRQRARLKLTILRLKFKWKGKNLFWFNSILFFILVCFFIAFSIPKLVEALSSHNVDGSFVGIVGPILPILYIGRDLKDAIKNPFDFSKFISSPNYDKHISFIEQFHSDFSKIVESYAGKSRVYVFIDDLDRCEIPKASELMKAINLMISDKANIYFIIGMDRKVIAAGVASRQSDVFNYLTNEKLDYGYEYIEKFIQVPFRVPSPKNNDFKYPLQI